jgi:hypothetical protein
MMENYMVFVAQRAKLLLRNVWVWIISSGGLILSACSSEPQSQTKGYEPDTTYVVPWEEIEKYMRAAPSPAQVSLWLRQEKVPFYREILHDPSLASRYRSLKGAANLGIYLTDMAYAHATNNYQVAYEYLTSANRLAQLYGLSDLLSMERIRELDRLQDKPDSLQRLFSTYYAEIQERLESTGQQALLRHMILGGWVESVHLTLHLQEKSPSKQGITDLIRLQKSLVPLMKKMYAIDTTRNSESQIIFAHLTNIETVLRKIPESTSRGAASTDPEKGLIRLEFQKDSPLPPDLIRELREKVSPLRQYLISA